MTPRRLGVHDGLRPVIGATYELGDAAQGLAAIENKTLTGTGKAVVRTRRTG